MSGSHAAIGRGRLRRAKPGDDDGNCAIAYVAEAAFVTARYFGGDLGERRSFAAPPSVEVLPVQPRANAAPLAERLAEVRASIEGAIEDAFLVSDAAAALKALVAISSTVEDLGATCTARVYRVKSSAQ